jgi:hypothetical protein
MTFEGVVQNGTVVISSPAAIPEGTRVTVTILEAETPTLLSLLEFAGKANDLPADMAEQHDHYIHGTPKR